MVKIVNTGQQKAQIISTRKLQNAKVENSGTYRIVLSNSKGSVETQTEVSIAQPKPEPPKEIEFDFVKKLENLSILDGKCKNLKTSKENKMLHVIIAYNVENFEAAI